MWQHKEITREEFERIKDKVESIIIKLGGSACNISLPYTDKITSVYGENEIILRSTRPAYKYNGEYYRVGEVCLERPFIVIEYGDYNDLINNTMVDSEPFPYDLSEAMLENEVKYSLGIL